MSKHQNVLPKQIFFSFLVQSQGPLKWPISDHHGDIVDGGLVLQDVMDFVRGEPGNIFSIDLQNLITKSVNLDR